MRFFLLLLFLVPSLSHADSAVTPEEYFKTAIIAGVTTEKSKITGSWDYTKGKGTITLEPSGVASWSDGNSYFRGSWAMQKNGVVVLKLINSASKEWNLYCYLRNDELIEDQICYLNIYARKKK